MQRAARRQAPGGHAQRARQGARHGAQPEADQARPEGHAADHRGRPDDAAERQAGARREVTTPRHKLPAQRRQEILRAVRSGSAHVSELAGSFGVSEMTVRRDLRALAREGKVERVRGGAVNAEHRAPVRRDGGRALRGEGPHRRGGGARWCEDGQTVMIDIGTTTLQAAHHLHGRDITVVTTSLAVYEELVPDPGDRADPARRRRAAQLPLARRRARRGLAAPAQGRRAVPRHERGRRASWACGTPRWSRCRSSGR